MDKQYKLILIILIVIILALMFENKALRNKYEKEEVKNVELIEENNVLKEIINHNKE